MPAYWRRLQKQKYHLFINMPFHAKNDVNPKCAKYYNEIVSIDGVFV